MHRVKSYSDDNLLETIWKNYFETREISCYTTWVHGLFLLPLFIVEFLKTCTSHIENDDDFNWPFKKLRDKKYTVYYRITQLDTHSTINLPAQKYIVWSFNEKNA